MDTTSAKDEIKRRVKIEDVISQHVVLQRAGGRLKARCPFHEEKTPSFYVNPALGLYKCFGCGAGGDVFDFVMKLEGLTFSEAGERLAERAGIAWRVQPGEEARTKRRQSLRRANESAAAFFADLLHAPGGQVGHEYLVGRGFTPETIDRFRLGYAPDSWDALLRHLRQQGIDESVAAEAGLARERATGGYYDVFRHRVVFPIIDVSDRVIGFGGRALDPGEAAKYLNTADTPMFKKGHHVYALNLARTAISRSHAVVIVEGYTDVLALHQAGIENVVACLGTALTSDHLELLARYAEEIILAYDADAAGVNAAARNIPMLEACPAEVRIVLLPEGLDPDEAIRRDGAEGFTRLLANRTTPVEYLIDLEFAKHADRGSDGVLQAARAAVEVLVGVRDRARMNAYVARVLDRWGHGNPQRTQAIEGPLREELDRRLSQRPAAASVRPDSPRDRRFITERVAHLADEVPGGVLASEREVVGAALSNQMLAAVVTAALKPADLFAEAHQEILVAVAAQLSAAIPYDAAGVIARLAEDGPAREVALALSFADAALIDQEVLTRDIAKIREYRAGGRHGVTYEIPPDEEAPSPEPIENFEALRQRVAEKINAGTLSPEDPDYVLYQRHTARSHGVGALGYVGAGASFLAGATLPGPAPQATASQAAPAGGGTPQSPLRPPVDEGS